MSWINLTNIDDLAQIDLKSNTKTQLLFKHSTRCSISVTVHNRIKEIPETIDADCYYLDLLQHRDISNAIAEKFKVHHESPQVIVIQNGEAIYDESHLAIDWDDIKTNITPISNP
jgi:bacillithiol system protein YtxJ